MPIPPNAAVFGTAANPAILDPADILDFYVSLAQGAEDAVLPPILLVGEAVATLAVAVTTEAAAVGLKIMTGGSYPAPKVDPATNVVTLWLGVDSARQGDSVFNGVGVTVGVELTITTNNNPPRVKQRTVSIKVAQQ